MTVLLRRLVDNDVAAEQVHRGPSIAVRSVGHIARGGLRRPSSGGIDAALTAFFVTAINPQL